MVKCAESNVKLKDIDSSSRKEAVIEKRTYKRGCYSRLLKPKYTHTHTHTHTNPL